MTGKSEVLNRKALPVRKWDDPELLVKIRWDGVNFYEFVLPNGKTIVMDPYFDDPNDAHNEFKYTPTDLPAGEYVNGADIIVLTHGHFDHTGNLAEVLDKYPNAHIILPEHTIPSVIVSQNIDYNSHYFTEAGPHDRFEFDGVTLETCRSNHNVGRAVNPLAGKTGKLYEDENGNIDFFKIWKMVYERELINVKFTTAEGFTILLWNSQMGPDGRGFETRRYFYEDAQPDLFMYQVAGASFGGNRRNPDCGPMGKFIASVKAKTALPEHQQHFSYDELDRMAEQFAEHCDEAGVETSFLTPESGVWYGYTKDADGNVGVCLVEK
ncbi:MAG: MBL fold metallo-hydrolase [Erysipelotrichaceae bacterium]|nr:MBL fold metallo-hydrolase [Erysipelotrichaceae bacterium]